MPSGTDTPSDGDPLLEPREESVEDPPHSPRFAEEEVDPALLHEEEHRRKQQLSARLEQEQLERERQVALEREKVLRKIQKAAEVGEELEREFLQKHQQRLKERLNRIEQETSITPEASSEASEAEKQRDEARKRKQQRDKEIEAKIREMERKVEELKRALSMSEDLEKGSTEEFLSAPSSPIPSHLAFVSADGGSTDESGIRDKSRSKSEPQPYKVIPNNASLLELVRKKEMKRTLGDSTENLPTLGESGTISSSAAPARRGSYIQKGSPPVEKEPLSPSGRRRGVSFSGIVNTDDNNPHHQPRQQQQPQRGSAEAPLYSSDSLLDKSSYDDEFYAQFRQSSRPDTYDPLLDDDLLMYDEDEEEADRMQGEREGGSGVKFRFAWNRNKLGEEAEQAGDKSIEAEMPSLEENPAELTEEAVSSPPPPNTPKFRQSYYLS